MPKFPRPRYGLQSGFSVRLGCALLVIYGGVLLGMGAQSIPILLRPHPLDLAYLSVPDPTRTCMRSGYDYADANYDSGNLIRVEPAGQVFTNAGSEWVLFDAAGPGVITSIWFTGKSKQGQAYLGGRLNFYFDGEPRPRVAGELPDLFESPEVFPSGLAEKSSGGWLSYAPIYYARHLKITLSDHRDSFAHRKNGRGETIPHVYHQFTYQRLGQEVSSSTRQSLEQTRPWTRDTRGQEQTRRVLLRAGQTNRLFAATGPGILKKLRLDLGNLVPNLAGLRITTDGKARVDLTVAEFWGFSRAKRPKARFDSLLLGADESGVYSTWWPMPYRESLTVDLIHRGQYDGEIAVTTLHANGWPEPEHFYFHATLVTDRTEPGRDLRLLDRDGRGHFVGTILALADKTLEGDDRFFVDGEAFPPCWHGTGTEDYFRCGWYFFGGPLTRPLYGLLDGARPKVAYRFHVADRVNFQTSVRIGFEHGHGNEYIGPFSGVVFWYANE